MKEEKNKGGKTMEEKTTEIINKENEMKDLQKEINSFLENVQKEISSLLEKNFSKEEAIEILLSTFTPILAHIVKRNEDCLQFRKKEALWLAEAIIELDRMKTELSRKKIGIAR